MTVVLARSFRSAVPLCLCACLLAACGGGGGKKAKGTTTSTVQQLVAKTANLKAGVANVETAGPLAGIDNSTGALVLRNAQKYLDTAIFAPLASDCFLNQFSDSSRSKSLLRKRFIPHARK